MIFVEKNLYDIFSLYGEVVSVKIRMKFTEMQSLSTAYVAFKTHEQAQFAVTELDGKCLALGTEPIKVEFYSSSNKFLGLFRGLEKKQLVDNSHFRVLFLSGID